MRAWIVEGHDGRGVVWAETRSKARMVVARVVVEARRVSMRDALAGLCVHRAADLDRYTGQFPPRACVSPDTLVALARVNR